MTTPGPMISEWPSRRKVLLSLGRILLAVLAVLVVYVILPESPNSKAANWIVIVVGLAVFLAVTYWQFREVTQSTRPVVRAIEALAISLSMFLILFASQYVAESGTTAGSFSEPLDKFSALYYTVTVFSTVGFGDITPVSDVARSLTMAQMIGNLIVLGVGVRILTSVAQQGLARQRAAATSATPPQG